MSHTVRGPGREKPNRGYIPDHHGGGMANNKDFVMPMVGCRNYGMPGHVSVQAGQPHYPNQFVPQQQQQQQQQYNQGYYQHPQMQRHPQQYSYRQDYHPQQPYMYQSQQVYQEQATYQPHPSNQQQQPPALPTLERKRAPLLIVDPKTQQAIDIVGKTPPAPAAVIPDTAEAAEKKQQFEREFKDKVIKELNDDQSKPPNTAQSTSSATVAAAAPLPTNFNVPPPNFGQTPPANIPVFVPKAQRTPEPQETAPAVPEPAPEAEEPKTPPVAVDVQVKCSPAETATTGASESVAEVAETVTPSLQKVDSKEEAEDDKFDENDSQCDESATPEPGSGELEIEKTPEELAQEKAQKEAEAAEKRKQLEEQLDARLNNCFTAGEADISKGMYCREFMMTVREYEKTFQRTPCPLSPEQLNKFGLDIKFMRVADKKPNFTPNWAQPNKGNRQQNPYRGRTTTDGTGRGAGQPRDRQNHKRPPVVRPSIERVQRVTLPTSKDAWKPDRQRAADDTTTEEAAVKEVCKKVRSLMNKITPTSQIALTKEFISYKVSSNEAQLSEVVGIVFDKAVEEPKFCSLYAELCKAQADHEISQPDSQGKSSAFRNMVLTRTQATFQNKAEYDEEKMAVIAKEEDPEKRKLLEMEERQKFRRRKFGVMTFIGHLFRNQLLSTKIVHVCVFELCTSILPKKQGNKDLPIKSEDIDEESVHCALQLIETVGNLLDKLTKKGGTPAFLDQWLEKLNLAKPFCSNKIRFMIMNLIELRNNQWVPRKSVETGPKKISEIHNEIKQEKVENEKARDQYDRDRDRRHGGVRTNSNSMRKNAPVSRNSLERKGFQPPELRRAAAAANTKLASTSVQPKNISLSGMNDSALGGGKNRWQAGAAGGGNTASEAPAKAWTRRDSNDQRKRSTVDERAAVIAAAKEVGNSSTRRSGSQNSIPDQTEEELTDEQKEQRQKIMNSLDSDLKEVLAGDSTLNDVVDSIKSFVGQEKYAKPSLTAVYEMCVRTAVERPNEKTRRTLAHVLRLTLTGKEEKQAFLDGATNFCKFAVDVELWYDYPHVWTNTAEVITSVSHVSSDVDITNTEMVCLNDFNPCFLAAELEDKKYTLLVKVLTILAEAEIRETGDSQSTSWEFTDLKIRSKLEKEGLKEQLRAVKLASGKSLASVLYEEDT